MTVLTSNCSAIDARRMPATALRRLPVLLAALAFGLTPSVGAQPDAATSIFHGGTILTLDGGRPRVEAIAVRDGRIVALGSHDEVARLRGERTQSVDLAGDVLLPAFVDHHIHLLNVGLALGVAYGRSPLIDLSDASSIEQVTERIAAGVALQPPGTWIRGFGWAQGNWGATALPDNAALNAVAPDHPVYLTRIDGHAGWANDPALARAGIDAAASDPPGGAILRHADGRPTGLLLERANEALIVHIPALSNARISRAYRRAADALAAQGVVEVYDAGVLAPPGIVGLDLDFERYLNVLARTDAAGALPLRINVMIPAPSRLAETILADPAPYKELTPRLRVTHLKLFADGALGSRGAALSHPYADDRTTRGITRMNRADIEKLTHAALTAGLDVATHAIGDVAVADTLAAYRAVLEDRPDIDPGRLRIEHFSYARPADQRLAAALGVVLSIQPNFVLPDDAGRTMEDARLGHDNARRAYAWKTLAGVGAVLAGSSDYFARPGPPLLNFQAAVTRENAAGRPAGGWHPQERLSRARALRLFTSLHRAGGGAMPGTLTAGACADLVLLSADPLRVDEDALLDIRVQATWSAGVLTFRDGEARSAGPNDRPAVCR